LPTGRDKIVICLSIEGNVLKIRSGTINDIPAISKAYVESWRSTYRGLAPEVFVNGMTEAGAAAIFHESLAPNEYEYFLHVAEAEDGTIVGFADGGKERSHPEMGIGELYAVYLLQEFQRKGLGRMLWEASAKSLIASGMNTMVVWVLESNTNHPFYLSIGGVLQPGIKVLNVGGHEIRLVSYYWENLQGSFQ